MSDSRRSEPKPMNNLQQLNTSKGVGQRKEEHFTISVLPVGVAFWPTIHPWPLERRAPRTLPASDAPLPDVPKSTAAKPSSNASTTMPEQASPELPLEFCPDPSSSVRRPSTPPPLHSRRQIRLGRFHQQVVMIAHQNKGMNPPARFGASLSEGLKEQAPILIVPINRLLMISPTHHMIHCSREFDPQLACHVQSLPTLERSVNSYFICPTLLY